MEKVSRSGTASGGSSPSSIYEDQVVDSNWQNRLTPPGKDHLRRFDISNALPAPFGVSGDQHKDLETRRQELIVELCQTEDEFVSRLHVFVRLFILPLRVQDSKAWISGVPSEVARLFDWLDDIMVLHRQILSSLNSIRAIQYPIVERVAESLRAFVPRLEVYQPYLVKLGDAMSLINRLMQDDGSDFGEFVDIQEGAPECDGWNFEKFLVEPVNRLAKFPEFCAVGVLSSCLCLSSIFYLEVARIDTEKPFRLPFHVLSAALYRYGHTSDDRGQSS